MNQVEIEDKNLEAYCAPLGLVQAPEAHFGFLFGDAKYKVITPTIGMDHCSLWLTAKNVPYSFISQPYKKSFEWAYGVIEWNAICAQWELVWKLLEDGTGWHNHAKTHCIEFKRNPEVWDCGKQKTYAQLNRERVACEKMMLRDLH